jgi:hypothetical protein
LVVEGLPYGCPEHGSSRSIQSLCAINLPTPERKKKKKNKKKKEILPFRCFVNVANIFYVCPIRIFASQLLICRASTFVFYWAQKLLKPSVKSGIIY